MNTLFEILVFAQIELFVLLFHFNKKDNIYYAETLCKILFF